MGVSPFYYLNPLTSKGAIDQNDQNIYYFGEQKKGWL